MTRRIGLFGGTFDPPHVGHLAVARAVRDALGLDEVLLVPAGNPWQKAPNRPVTQAPIRLEMARALVADEPGLGVDDCEVVRPGPSYTVDTLVEVSAREPGAELYLIMGVDTFSGIPTWNRWQVLTDLSTIVVVNRASHAPVVPHDGLDSARVRTVEMAPVDVSSTMVRDTVGRGEPVSQFTGDAVAAIIEREGLYEVKS